MLKGVTRLFVGLVLFVVSLSSAAGVGPQPEAPTWQTPGGLISVDGFFELEWKPKNPRTDEIYRLVESLQGQSRESLVAGRQLRLYRAVPGLFEFTVQACARDETGAIECGRRSQPLRVDVSEKGEQSAVDEPMIADVSTVTDADGASRLRPGLWYNPDREGHGFSFYWANRLSLPETHQLFGPGYDLHGVWYTYEAKSLYFSPSGDLAPTNYQPLVARLRLVKESAERYSGGIFIRRQGQEAQVGSATVVFGGDNGEARVSWSADFKLERVSGEDPIVLLAGANPGETRNLTHYAGHWSDPASSAFEVVADVGSLSEAVEVLFEDVKGDPTWVQATNERVPSSTRADLCFYYVHSGYAPDAHGNIGFSDLGCNRSAPATSGNRNGERRFTDFERMNFWASISLPSNRGGFTTGSPNQPLELHKQSNFHRIPFDPGQSPCGLVNGDCSVAIDWFTDGDYPQASVFARNRNSGARVKLADAEGVVAQGRQVTLKEPGRWVFELRMGRSDNDTLIAESAELDVQQQSVAPPSGPGIDWLDTEQNLYRFSWRHPDPTGLKRFVIEEMVPGASGASFHLVSPSNSYKDFLRPDGPFGTYTYRVQACDNTGQCSEWSKAVGWQLSKPDTGGAPAHPWQELSASAGTLIENQSFHYAMGYHFRPKTDGSVRELGGRFNGTKTVRLFDRSTGQLLAEAVVSSTNDWRYAPVADVAVRAGQDYTVAVYLAGSGGSYYNPAGLPTENEDIEILATTYVSTSSDPDAVPVNTLTSLMYGQADIGFVASDGTEPPPDPEPEPDPDPQPDPDPDPDPGNPPADPETPPSPAPRPSFGHDSTSTRTGALAGEFFVDAQGGANYQVPLVTAPGAGGYAPELSLAYNSQAGNGALGVGWRIGGVSSITRCPQTREQDGLDAVHAVTLDREDRFCLDGVRLMGVQGVYGADGAEYRLETGGYDRIRSLGQAGHGPERFEIRHADGSISLYGNRVDSRIEARRPGDSQTVMTWALGRREDAAGNYAEYLYDESVSGGVEVLLESVRYTGNSRAGTQPYAELRFNYRAGRNDVPADYLRGAQIVKRHLLERVDSLSNVKRGDASMVSLRSWFLKYGKDGYGRNFLESVEACSDSSRSYCYPETRFDWLKHENRVGTTGPSLGQHFSRDFKTLNIADVNGDGRRDLLLTEGNNSFQLKLLLGQPDGSFSTDGALYPIPQGEDRKHPVALLTMDLDADGDEDVLYPRRYGGAIKWTARIAGNGGLGSEVVVSDDCCGTLEPAVARVMDFNGDGRPDLLTQTGVDADNWRGNLVVLLNASRPDGAIGFEPARYLQLDYAATLFPEDPVNSWFLTEGDPGFTDIVERTPKGVQAFDYDGDGAVDVLARIERRYVYCDTNCPTIQAATTPVAETVSAQTLDFNPEATADAEEIRVAFFVVFASDGQGRFSQTAVVGLDAEHGCEVPVACASWQSLPRIAQVTTVDIDGNGLADLAWRDAAGDWRYRLNTGDGFGASVPLGGPGSVERSELARFIDISGDGYPEFLYPDRLGSAFAKWTVHFNDLGSGFASAETSGILFGNDGEGDMSLLGDFNGDGLVDNLFIDIGNGRVKSDPTRLYQGENLVTGSRDAALNALYRVTDGLGKQVQVEYGLLTDPDVHTALESASRASYGRGSAVFDLVAPSHVVREVTRSAPAWGDPGAMAADVYHYVGARIQAGGRGFLGFAEVVSWNRETGLRTNTLYRQDFPFTGLVAETLTEATGISYALASLLAVRDGELPTWSLPTPETESPGGRLNGTTLAFAAQGWQAVETMTGSGAWNIRQAARLERQFSPGGELIKRRFVSTRYGVNGRVEEISERLWGGNEVSAALTLSTRHEYHPANAQSGILNRVARTSVRHQRPGTTAIERVSAYEYDPVSGRKTREVTAPDDPAFRVVTDYVLDDFGNRTKTTVSAADVPARNSRLSYDELGRFAVAEYNHYGQQVMRVEDWNAFGTPLRVTDIDGVVSESAADPMGRVFVSWTATGAWERTIHRAGTGGFCPDGTVMNRRTTAGGKPEVRACLDALQREIRSVKEGFDGRLVFTDTAFDAAGRPVRVSEPYLQGDASYWTATKWDIAGRIERIDAADGNDQSFSYGGGAGARCGAGGPLVTEVTNGLGQKRIEHRNAMGETVSVYDHECGEVTNRYDAIGNLVEVVGADGAAVRMAYDAAGRRVGNDDPDKGHWRYAWNALGEMTRQLDAKGQAQDFEYDAMGRVVKRLELSGVDSLSDTLYTVENQEATTWLNSTASSARGKGQAVEVTYRQGVTGAVIHRQRFSFDALGRVSETVTTIGANTFSESTTFDRNGRIFQSFDASGDFRGLRHRYNEHGYLEQLVEARDGTAGVVYRDIQALDARGNVSYALLGNGVEIFATRDPSSGRVETLEAYDGTGQELQRVDYAFDVAGNLLSRNDRSRSRDQLEAFYYDDLNRLTSVELTDPAANLASPVETLALAYDAAGNIVYKSDVGDYEYGSGSAGPHAVTRAGSATFQYDANGNQVSGDGRTIEYSTFDKATRIERNGQSTEFVYGIAHRRVTRRDANTTDGQREVIYVGSVEFLDDGSETRVKRHIAGVAESTWLPASGSSETRYIVRDHLGSVHSMTGENGLASDSVSMHFDAFGKRRAPDWRSALSQSSISALNRVTNRGFSGHEHVDAMGLVHMNGRIYDPRLGRFLQADPLVQSAADSQSLNRYSYALNNPLSYTDPSGYFLKRFVKRWGRLIVAMAVSVVLPGTGGILANVFNITGTYTQAAITGFVAGAIASGTLKGAVIGSITAMAVAGIVEAYQATEVGSGLADPDKLVPSKATMQHLHGNGIEEAGLYRVHTRLDGVVKEIENIARNDVLNGDVVFTNGVRNNFSSAIKNGTMHLYKRGMLGDSYILNFNPTNGFAADLLEATRDIVGAHFGGMHSDLARNLAGLVDGLSSSGITGIQLVGHSQGGAIVTSALSFSEKTGLNLSALSGGGASLHGAPVNAWMARERLGSRLGVEVVSRAQFGDAVHVLGGLNLSNPLELPVALLRVPALFSSDPSVSPHSLPCGTDLVSICSN